MAIFDSKNFEVNKTEGVATITYSDDNAFNANTDLTKAEIKRVFDHARDYVTEATELAATESTKIMEKDNTIDKVVVEYPYGVSKRGNVSVVAKRSQTFKSPADGTEVIKSTLTVAVKDPLTKIGKSKIKELTAAMTSTLLS